MPIFEGVVNNPLLTDALLQDIVSELPPELLKF